MTGANTCIPRYGTLPKMIDEQATVYENDTFLTDAETGDKLTYGDFADRTDRIAATLVDAGVRVNDTVCIIMPNSIPLVAAIAGILKAGGIAVPIAPDYTSREMGYVFAESESKHILTAASAEPTVSAAVDEIDCDVDSVLMTADYIDTDYNVERTVRPTDTALLMFTSGTTGDPKGVALSHLNLLFRFDGGEMPRGYDVFYTILPLYNIDGLITTFGTLYDGGCVLLRDGFSASSFWSDIEDYEADLTSVVPSILAILLEQGHPPGVTISSPELFVVSGSYVHEELVERFEDIFDIAVMEIYGLTEAAGTSYSNLNDIVVGSAGTPSTYTELRIVDEETADPVAQGEMGEIVLRGPTVFKEYDNNREATEAVRSGGWFHTEDIGYVDEIGRLYVRNRIKDIIIRGGQNIYPGEIEEVLHTHSAVEDVAVVGESDEIYGELVIAYVTTRAVTDREELSEDLIAYSRKNLVDFKVPAEVRLVESFPRGETGKILKENLGE